MCIRERSWCKHVGLCWELAREKDKEGEEEGISRSVREGRRGKGLNKAGGNKREQEKRDRHSKEEVEASPLLFPAEHQGEPRRHTGLEPLQTLPLPASSPWWRGSDAQGGWRSADALGLHVPLAREQAPSAWAPGAQLWGRVCPELPKSS